MKRLNTDTLNALIDNGFQVSIRRTSLDCVELVVGKYFGPRPLIVHDESASHAIDQLRILCSNYVQPQINRQGYGQLQLPDSNVLDYSDGEHRGTMIITPADKYAL